MPLVSKQEIHRLATEAKIPWDDDPKFKRWSKKLTGTTCLDKMGPTQRLKMKNAIVKRSKTKTADNRKVHSDVREALLSFFQEHNLPKDTPHAILAGGSMHLQGMNRKFNDIDVFVPALNKKKADSVHNGLEVDAGNTLFDKDYTKQVLKNRVHKDGLQLMSLPDVLEFKRRLNRPKDQRDIRALERYLKVKEHTRTVGGKSVTVKAHKRRVEGHVQQRAHQRSTVTNEEIKALRKSLLKMRLRKGMTYHYTWPGRGHAIIGDVGKKMPRHVVKTIYKPSDTPPGLRLRLPPPLRKTI